MKVGELWGEIALDDRPFAKTLADTERKAAESGKKVGDSFKDVGNKLDDAGKKLTAFAAVPLAAAMGGAIKAASDLNETVSKSNTIFGKAGAEMEAWAGGAATALGQSKEQALDAAGSFGNLFSQLGIGSDQAASMSRQMVQLASDFASFQNADVADVLEAQQAAFRGEYDAVQKFVPTISAATVEQKAMAMGLASSTSELDAQDKALATQALLLEGAGAAVGDFARTSDGAANKQRILRAEMANSAAEIGQKLLPAFSGALNLARDAIDIFSSLSPELQTTVLGFAGLAAAAGPVTTVVGQATKAIGLFRLEEGGINAGAVAATAGLAALALSAGAFAKAIADAKARAREFAEQVEGKVDTSSWNELYGSLVRNTEAAEKTGKQWLATRDDLSPLGAATKEFVENITPLPNKMADLRERSDELADRNKELREQLTSTNKALNSFATATGLSREEVEALAAKNKIDLTGSYGDITNALFKAKDGTEAQTGASSKLADVQAVLADKTSTAEERLKAFKTALDLALGKTLDITEASIRHQDAIDALTEKITANGASLDLLNPKSRETAAAFTAVIESAQGEVDALVAAGKITEGTAEEKKALIQRLDDLKKKFPELKQPIDEYIWSIASVPDTKTTSFTVDDAQAKKELDEIHWRIASLPKGVFLQAGVDLNAVIEGTAEPVTAPGRASGGSVGAGVLYRVNESEHEYFRPSTSGTVLTPLQAGAAMPAAPSPPEALIRIDHLEVTGSRDPDYSAVATTRELRSLAYLGGGMGR